MLRETLSSYFYGRSVNCTLDVLVLEGIIPASTPKMFPSLAAFSSTNGFYRFADKSRYEIS